eukprot:Cvel_23918.t1-p1 / transcript=Cvel_23918.t1 / gene=Cvel_23918 / organism=Chromera_velia_CCMP2878 / gene_product=hypothetical protein / transcript_product=hypothetical protein / location=Cvel_scaffold2524:171-854(-) / protein_length=131 / sequence_SO=supercontig / SO=protein_coding / is_pseudo=false
MMKLSAVQTWRDHEGLNLLVFISRGAHSGSVFVCAFRKGSGYKRASADGADEVAQEVLTDRLLRTLSKILSQVEKTVTVPDSQEEAERADTDSLDKPQCDVFVGADFSVIGRAQCHEADRSRDGNNGQAKH